MSGQEPYTEFEESIPCSARGYAVGPKGSEVEIIDDEGIMIPNSSSIVTITAGVTLTAEEHGNRTIVMNHASGVTVVLPEATGSGFECTLIAGVTLTGGSNVIEVASTASAMNGSKAFGIDDDGEGATGYSWMAEVGDNTITMDATATGGSVGDSVKIIDYKSGLFKAMCDLTQSGGSEATPFTAGVS